MSMDEEIVLAAALVELSAAVEELLTSTVPSTPLPRPRVFTIVDGIVWPCQRDGKVDWRRMETVGGWPTYRVSVDSILLARELVDLMGRQPRKILRALRRVQAAAAWCRARAEGRRRMAQEILRQQGRAVEALEAEAALAALGGN